jgi:hypothetical protein
MQIKRTVLMSLLAAILLFAIATCGQALSRSSKSDSEVRGQPESAPPINIELENLHLQQARFEFDKKKAESDADREERKLGVEKSKVWWSAIATAVPLVVGVIVVIAGFRSQYKQSKHQFELKAAEIIFTGTTPQAVLNRGKVLKALFGDNLSKDFLKDFKPEDYSGYKETSEDKRFFLEQILKTPEKKSEITQLWFRTFPGDYKWLVRAFPEEFKDSDLPEIQKLLKGTPFEKKDQELPPPKHRN